MIQVNDSKWPIVRISFIGDVSLGDVEKLAVELKRIHSCSGNFVVVSDLTELRAASVTARIRQAIARTADDFAERGALRAEAVVVSHPVLRALFTGYTWLRRNSSHPQQTFSDFASAYAWALRQAGAMTQQSTAS